MIGQVTEPTAPEHGVLGLDVSDRDGIIEWKAIRDTGIRWVVIRAGRGTRQDRHWIENVEGARSYRLQVGSYWYVLASRASSGHQAELWNAAIETAGGSFALGHWAVITRGDGMNPTALDSYVGSLLGRFDALADQPARVLTTISDPPLLSPGCLQDRIVSRVDQVDAGVLRRAPDGFVHEPVDSLVSPTNSGGESPTLHLVRREPNDSDDEWRKRWLRASSVGELQQQLNGLGAFLQVDSTFGPATEHAVRAFQAVVRRDNDPTIQLTGQCDEVTWRWLRRRSGGHRDRRAPPPD